MTYRSDLDALTARQVSLQAELDRKQRELAEISGMLAEVRRVEQAESYFEGAPEQLRRRRLHLVAGALAVTLVSGTALGAVSSVVEDSRRTATEVVDRALAKLEAGRTAHERAQRLRAEVEALQALHLIPVVAPNAGIRLAERSRRAPAWLLGSGVPVRGSLWQPPTPESLARKDQR